MRTSTSNTCFRQTERQPREKEAAASRKRYRRNPALYREYCRKYCYSNPRARYCHLFVYLALKSGKVVREPCEICGNPKTDAHHDDYSKPMEIRWLCRSHHRKLHRSKP